MPMTMTYLTDKKGRCPSATKGFSMIELIIVVTVILVLGLVAGPSLSKTMATYRGSAAISGVAGQLALSKMRAAADFTRTKLAIDTANGTWVRQIYDKTAAAYVTEGGTQYLPRNVSFGYGSITTP